MAEGRVAVSNEIVGRFVPGKGIGDLAGDPLRRRIGRHAERYQPPRWCLRMTKTKSNLKPTVGPTRKSMAAMPAATSSRSATALARSSPCIWRRSTAQPRSRASGVHNECAAHPKSPAGQAHLSDQPTRSTPTETGDGARRKAAIGYRQLRLRGKALAQHIQLMPQQDDLGFQSRLRLERRDQDVDEQVQKRDHCDSAYPISPLKPARMEFSVKTGHRQRHTGSPQECFAFRAFGGLCMVGLSKPKRA
jgi:hypothetical protein